jgi:hypothetical protein
MPELAGAGAGAAVVVDGLLQAVRPASASAAAKTNAKMRIM